MVVLGLVSVMFLMGFSSYNGLIDQEETVQSSWAQVMNTYQRRSDLIPNLVALAEREADIEKSTLEEVVSARAKATSVNLNVESFKNEAEMQKFMQTQQQLSSSLGRLLAITETYPQLQSLAAFRDLMSQLEGTENRITEERRKFNEAVKEYNSSIRKFPKVVFAGILGFEKFPYYEGEKDQNIQQAPDIHQEIRKSSEANQNLKK